MIWPWPDLTCGQILKLTFQDQKVHISNRLDEKNTMVSFLFSDLPCKKKLLMKKTSQWKQHSFHLMTSGAKTIGLRSNLTKNVNGAWGELLNVFFFEFFLAITLLEIIAIVCEKINFLKNWPLVTSILTWPENNLSKSLRYRRGLSYTLYRLSLSNVVFELGGGGGDKAPPPPETEPFRARPE